MATGFLTDPTYATQAWREISTIQRELYRSNSAAFMNRMLCGEAKWSNCSRPQSIQAAAKLLGWDAGCLGNVRCGMNDILFGRQSALDDSSQLLDPLATHALHGRLLTEEKRVKSGIQELVADFAFDPSLAADCRDNRAWKKCDRHGRVAELVSAGWGQGNARATAVGVAGMMGRLAAAANGQSSQRPPHLVRDVTDAKGKTVPVAALRYGLNPEVPVQVPQAVAQAIFKGLSGSHRSLTKDQQGTAFWGVVQRWVPVFATKSIGLAARLARRPMVTIKPRLQLSKRIVRGAPGQVVGALHVSTNVLINGTHQRFLL